MTGSEGFGEAVLQRYTRVAIVIHWLTALFILVNPLLGHIMEGASPAFKPILIPLHIWIGLSVLLLTTIRVAWRLTHRPPPYPPGYTRSELRLAGVVHASFYALLIAMPVVGYLLVSANPPNPHRHLTFWGVIPLPSPVALQTMNRPAQIILHDQFVTAHAIGGWLIVTALALHLAGVIKHQFFDGTYVLRRIAPLRR
jgi:cytochrome b561